MIRRIAPPPTVVVALLLGLALAACAPRTVTREVYVRIPAPAPTIVVSADTLVVTTPPDTVFVPREVLVPGATRVVTLRDTVVRTVPAVVIRYATPRPPRDFQLVALEATPDTLRVAGLGRDWLFRTPARGERLTIEAFGPDSLAAAVTGSPQATQARVHAECPAPVSAIIERSAGGWTRLAIWLMLAGCFGAVAVLLVVRR